MDNLLVIIADGVLFASWLFLVAVGLTLIYGVMRILNIAHGSLYAIGAYTGAVFVITYCQKSDWLPGSYLVLLGAAISAGLVLGTLMERGVLRWFYGKEVVLQLLSTYAIFLILEDVLKLVFGVKPYYAYKPLLGAGNFIIGGVNYPRYYLILFFMAVLAGILLWLFMNKTRFGKLVLAVIHDPEISLAMGIKIDRIYIVAFSLGAILAALGGAFTAPMTVVVPGLAVEVIVISFAVVIIGGLGSFVGAGLGALIVGLVRSLAVHYVPELELFTIYFVMAAVLLFRPQGLFPTKEVRKI
ncbi:MAG: branched-chain amino acid ABC transporter permease [Bacillota bacterium]